MQRVGSVSVGRMTYTTVAVISAPVYRDGVCQPGFLYLSSNAAADSSGNLGRYDVWARPGPNPFPATDARWVGALSDVEDVLCCDPADFDTDLRHLLDVTGKHYILYYFYDWQYVLVQSFCMMRHQYVCYRTDVWFGSNWYYASDFTYEGIQELSRMEWAD